MDGRADMDKEHICNKKMHFFNFFHIEVLGTKFDLVKVNPVSLLL